MNRFTALILPALLFLSTPALSQWTEIESPNGLGGEERFGDVVAADDNLLSVWAIGSQTVYTYDWSGGQWVYHSSFSESAETMVVANGQIIVGEVNSDEDARVQIYTRDNNVWTLTQTIEQPEGDSRFGSDIVTNSTFLYISSAEAIYTYFSDNGSWALRSREEKGQGIFYFARRISLSDDKIAVLARNQDLNYSVLVYTIDEVGRLTLRDTINLWDQGLYSVATAIDLATSNLLYVSGINWGTAYAFEYTGDEWDRATSHDVGWSQSFKEMTVSGGFLVQFTDKRSYLYRYDNYGSYPASAQSFYYGDSWHQYRYSKRGAITDSHIFVVAPFLDKIAYLQRDQVLRRSIGVAPADSSVGNTRDLVFQWDSDAGATTHNLQIALNSSFSSGLINTEGIGSSEQLIENLASAQTYYWRVRSSKEGDEGWWSPVFSFSTEYQVAPIVEDDIAALSEDESVLIDVLSNDSDPDDDVLQIIGISPATYGQVVIEDGQIRYTPEMDFNGQDSFAYTVRDEYTHEVSGTVTVTVNPVPDSPIANDDTCSVNEDVATGCDVLSNDTDADGDALTAVIIDGAKNGAASISGSQINYLGSTNYTGPDSLQYLISDGTGRSGMAWLRITVEPVNDDPIVAGESVTMAEDGTTSLLLLTNDTDPDGDTLLIQDISAPNGWFALLSRTASGDPVRITPPTDFYGQAEITYMVSDGISTQNEGKIDVSVLPVNDAPSTPEVISPEDNELILVSGTVTDSLFIAWSESEDVDGDSVAYELDVQTDQGTQLISQQTTSTSFGVSYTDLIQLMTQQGSGDLGNSLELHLTVSASDDSTTVSSQLTRATLERGAIVGTESFELPESFVLKAAYPNPFNPTTTITYGLPAAAEVRITATDLLGRQVATLVAGDMKAAGYHAVQFNADVLASGTYLIRMEAGDFVATQQVVLLK